MSANLLDLLSEIETGEHETVWHKITPAMTTACGTVQTCGGNCGGGCPPQPAWNRFTLAWDQTTCSLCLAARVAS